MSTRDRPTPPNHEERAREALSELEKRDADTLRAVGDYLAALADWKEAEAAETGKENGGDKPNADESDDLEYPDGVPERASVSVREIGGTTYRYYQWREGDRIESKTVKR